MAQLRNELAFEWVRKRIEELLTLSDNISEADVSNPVNIELTILSDLAYEYDKAHYAPKNAFGELVKDKMYERRLKQKQLAALLNISPTHLSEIMTGKATPSLPVMKAICQTLHLDANRALGLPTPL